MHNRSPSIQAAMSACNHPACNDDNVSKSAVRCLAKWCKQHLRSACPSLKDSDRASQAKLCCHTCIGTTGSRSVSRLCSCCETINRTSASQLVIQRACFRQATSFARTPMHAITICAAHLSANRPITSKDTQPSSRQGCDRCTAWPVYVQSVRLLHRPPCTTVVV
jgi:hypothetical protein